MSTDNTSLLTPLEARKKWEQLARQDQNSNASDNNLNTLGSNGNSHTSDVDHNNDNKSSYSDSIDTSSVFISSNHFKNSTAIASMYSGSTHNQSSCESASAVSPKSFQPPPEIHVVSASPAPETKPTALVDNKPKIPSQSSKPHTCPKPKPVVSKKPSHLSKKPSDLAISVDAPKLSKPPAPPPPSHKPNLNSFIKSQTSNSNLKPVKNELKLDIAKKPPVKAPERKNLSPPPEIPLKSLKISKSNATIATTPSIEIENSSDDNYLNINRGTTPPPPPPSTRQLRPAVSKDPLRVEIPPAFKRSNTTRPKSAVAESFSYFNNQDHKVEANRSVSTPTGLFPSPTPVHSSICARSSSVGKDNSHLIPPPVPPSRPVTPTRPLYKPENDPIPSPGPKSAHLPPPPIHSNIAADSASDINQTKPTTAEPSSFLSPVPTSFLPPPRHHAINSGSKTPDPYSSNTVSQSIHRRGSSYAVAAVDSSKLMPPPPPPPLHHPKPSTPVSHGLENHLGAEIKPPPSPIAPPPPPSRKLKSPIPSPVLRDDLQAQSYIVPPRAISPKTSEVPPNFVAPAPVAPVPVVPASVNSVTPSPVVPIPVPVQVPASIPVQTQVSAPIPIAHMAPNHVAPIMAAPVPVAAVPIAQTSSLMPPSATTSIPPSSAHPGTIALPTNSQFIPAAVPLVSPSFLSSLPDPTSFPPPPQRGDYFPAPPRRISDSTASTGSHSVSSSTYGSQMSLLHPPPTRRSTGGNAFNGTNFSNNSNASINSIDNQSSEDGAGDSDEGSPTALAASSQNMQYPDFSQSNRRAPIFGGPLHEISSRGKVDAIGFYGTTVCFSSASTTVAMDILTGERFWALSHSDTKITAIEFKPEKDPALCGRIVWLGTKEGHLWEVDLHVSDIRQKRVNVHMFPVVAIQAVGDTMWTLSEDGKICIWESYINDTPKVFRMTPHFKAWCIIGDHIWVGKNRQVSAYHPSLSQQDSFNITGRPIPCFPLPPGKTGCEFTCAACVQKYPDYVFFGHDDGTITVFSRSKGVAIETVNIALHKIASMSGVGSHLWVGSQSGTIFVVDIGVKPWKIIKEWKSHESSVRAIVSNEKSFFSSPQMTHMPVISVSSEQGMLIWDGLLKTDWIENDMNQHDSEFCSFDDIGVLYVTWNAGAARPSDLDRTDYDRMFLSTAFNRACPDYKNGPEIIVFGFQELVELDNKSVTAKTMFKSKKDKKEKYQKVATSTHISHQYKDWQDRLGREVTAYFADNYNLVHSSNMVGLFTCVYVKAGESSRIRSIKSGKTKTGLGGFHGNKGGIAVRLMVDDSSICFVNSHLAAGQNHTSNRNKDIEAILETPFLHDSDNTKYIGKGIFSNGGNGVMVLDHEFCFFAGDLNYRINLHRPTALQMIQEKDYPRLLDADQLLMQLKKDPSHRLRAFQEAKINFPPTYKFDVGTDTYDTSEKRRVPAWCDRIYYRGRDLRVTPEDYGSLAVRVSDHKPVMGLYKLKVKTIDSSLRKEVYKDSLLRWQNHLNESVNDLAKYYKGNCR